MYSANYIWAKVLAHIENRLTSAVTSAWFEDAEVVELTDKKITIYTPSTFCKEMIQRRCISYIKDAMLELFDSRVEVEVLGNEELKTFKEKEKQPNYASFNPQFTFDTFVVGPSNQFAHGAAIAVANNPAEAYNPLFIYGESGLGKTHLLYAIAAEIQRQKQAKGEPYNIVYIKGEQFTNELIASLQEGKNAEFRKKYRNADLFLVDDIQFIAGRESTQQEFFYTFNELHNEKIDIIEYDTDSAIYIAKALSPARVLMVYVNEEEKAARVIVPDSQLSLAIGKEGQNARLAAKLTGWKIDIKSQSQADAAVEAAAQQEAEE